MVVCRVLVVSGNMNMAIPTLGVNKMIRSLDWDRAAQFRETPTGLLRFDGRIGEGSILTPSLRHSVTPSLRHYLVNVAAGTYCERGALRYLSLRSAGHFISISQPSLALRILHIFSSDSFQTCY